MSGILRADWLRLRKRRTLQFIVIAVPLLAAFFFLTGYASNRGSVQSFDPQAFRQQLIDEGAVQGATPEEAQQMLDQLVESERSNFAQMAAQQELILERYSFPQSLLTTLGSSGYVLFALILLTATTLGDEFGNGTIRTSLLASSDRRRFLFVRLGLLLGVAAMLLMLLVLLGLLLSLVLVAAGASFQAQPPIDGPAFLVLLLGNLVAVTTVIAFAALATLLVRSGSLTLVVVLAYVAIEGVLQALFQRFPEFGPHGAYEWVPTLFPARAFVSVLGTASQAAGSLPNYPGEVVAHDLAPVWLPLAAIAAWGAAFITMAFRRFSRMDIVE